MNQDWQEKRIKQLFHELGREDERKAPSFTGVLQAALLRGGVAHRRLRLWRLACVAPLPFLAAVVVLLLFASHSTEPAPPGDFTTLQRLPNRETASPGIVLPPDVPRLPRAVLIKQPRHRRRASPTHNSTLLISQWQSPTDYLLRVPGNELLKSIPRVPDPSSGITRNLIEKHN